jgi:hypothetical protein
MAVDELTLKVTAKLHEPRSTKTKELVSWTPLGALSTTPAQYLCVCAVYVFYDGCLNFSLSLFIIHIDKFRFAQYRRSVDFYFRIKQRRRFCGAVRNCLF